MLIALFNILGEGAAIICLANLVTIVTSISMSAVCTNGQIKAGKVFVKFIYDHKNLLCYNEIQKIMCTKIIITLFVLFVFWKMLR